MVFQKFEYENLMPPPGGGGIPESHNEEESKNFLRTAYLAVRSEKKLRRLFRIRKQIN